jgi:hypothetical protein
VEHFEKKHDPDPIPTDLPTAPAKDDLFKCTYVGFGSQCHRVSGTGHWHKKPSSGTSSGKPSPAQGALLRLARKKAIRCKKPAGCPELHYHNRAELVEIWKVNLPDQTKNPGNGTVHMDEIKVEEKDWFNNPDPEYFAHEAKVHPDEAYPIANSEVSSVITLKDVPAFEYKGRNPSPTPPPYRGPAYSIASPPSSTDAEWKEQAKPAPKAAAPVPSQSTALVVLPPAAKPKKSKRELNFDTEVVEIASLSDLKNYTLRQKISSFAARCATSAGYEGISRTMEQRRVTRNVNAVILGIKCGHATRNVDTLRALGYRKVESATIYSSCHDYLMTTPTSRPRACDADGKPSNLLSTHLGTILKHDYPVWSERADPIILADTICYTYQKMLIIDIRAISQHSSIKLDYYQSGSPPRQTVQYGFTRERHTPPKEELLYEFNGKWLLEGKGWKDNALDVSALPRYNGGGYDTHFMSITSDVETHLVCPEHVRNMSTRVFGKRKPERPGLHDQCVANQKANIEEFKGYSAHLIEPVRTYILDRLPTDWNRLLDLAVENAPPEKRKAYAINRKELMDECKFADVEQYLTSLNEKTARNEYKQKGEKAKAGKASRQVVNLGIKATLVGSVLLKLMKEAFEELMTLPGENVRFVKRVNRTEMDQWAQTISDGPEGSFAGFVHSDDGSFVARDDLGLHRVDVDISGCDSSHGDVIFDMFTNFFPLQWRWLVRLLDAQIMRTCKIYLGKKCITGPTATPLERYLPSGHIYTTAINTLVLFSIMQGCHADKAYSKDEVELTGIHYGYILSVDVWPDTNGPMFLKHRIVRTHQGSRAVLALGVFLRSLGRCRGDLPGYGKLDERAREFLYSFISSYAHGIEVPFLEEMKQNFARKKRTFRTSKTLRGFRAIEEKVKKEFNYKHDLLDDSQPVKITDEEFLSSYFHVATPAQLLGMVHSLKKLRIGDRYRSRGTEAVLKADYGLGPGRHFAAHDSWQEPTRLHGPIVVE